MSAFRRTRAFSNTVLMMDKNSLLTTLGIAAIILARASANQARPSPTFEFEVASIKPNRSVAGERGAGFQTNGRFLARNMPLRSLIAIAYGEPRPLPDFQIAGGPGWIGSDRFDVEAKARGNFPETQTEPGFSTSGELMLQALLAERFKLAVHKETRQLPIYALTTARRDGRPDPRLTSSTGADCAKPPEGPPCGVLQFVGGTAANLRHARGRFMTMDQLAKGLEASVDRVVLNRTGLGGSFSFDFEFTPLPRGASPDSTGTNDPAVSIFTALQEQLGLKLESTRGPVDVIVIDHADRPTPD